MLTALALGCLLGLRHAFDPDHVVAITAIAARLRRPLAAGWIALAWGAGHTVTLLGVGALIVAGRLAIPTRAALALELGVGIVLIVLGARNLARCRRRRAPVPDPEHSERLPAEAFGVGLVHGLAGSAGVALLALAAVRTPEAALAYLVALSSGVILGMVALSFGLAVPFARAGAAGGQRWITAGSGGLALGFGVYLVYEIAFVQGLL